MICLHILYFFKGNQNGNVQEVFEQKNMRYPNIRTEDDSHFFTYFTVIIVACIAGYIGYHNKQKVSLIHTLLYSIYILSFLTKFFYVLDTCYCIRGSKIQK